MSIKKIIILLSLLILSVLLIIIFGPNNKLLPIAPTTPLPTPLTSFTAPILIYHYVEYVKDEKDTIRKSLNITPYVFVKQIETLKNAGYTFVTASELIDILDGKIKLPQKPIVITFDDGYRDFYTDVFPILKKYDVKAVAYIVSGFLDKPNYMYAWQLKEIARSGLVEIAAHTIHHYSLKGLEAQTTKYEIEESKITLEKLIGISVVSFAYPDGSFDMQAIKLVKSAGFKSAVTTLHGFEVSWENKFSLYRIHPGDKTGNSLLNFLEQK
mgnify:FL=1